ncbi:hypothetical protein F4818DRAFT_310060 [Hypoxylon cercidicola]|nr:hypothetical protein F4818DRAFT_310060 [Hypoxylon cercidicola]
MSRTQPSSLWRYWHINWCYFLSLVGSKDYGLPSMRTIVLAWISFVFSLLLGTVFAAQKPSPDILVGVLSILAVAVAFLCLTDWLKRRRAHARGSVTLPVYSRDLGNTVATSIITLLAIPLLYIYVWYPGLNRDVITWEKDIVVRLSPVPVPTNRVVTDMPLAVGPSIFPFNYSLST